MKKHISLLISIFTTGTMVFAGNPDRAGSAGAGHLLVNPWARSSGLGYSAMASVLGAEATFSNVAGLAFVKRTDLIFSSNNYLVGTGIKINTFGLGQRLGENGGVLGISVTNMNFGDIPITEEALPEGGIGSFSPNYSNIGLSYAKGFSDNIYGGLTVRLISESIYNVRSQGASFDAGIRYVTGPEKNLRFGISLRNVGPPMRYKGDGLSITATIPSNGNSMTVEQRSERYELPSLVNVGFAYDFHFGEEMMLTTNGQYTSNSFTKDQWGVSGEFSFRKRFIARAGYVWENGLNDPASRTTVFTGPSGGLTVQMPTKGGAIIGLDYSYRTTNPFNGVHSMGIHIEM
jgi:hypothetical protein